MTPEDFSRCWTALQALFPRYGQQSEDTFLAYLGVFGSLPADDFRAAAKQCAMDLDQFPSARELLSRLPGPPRPDADQAWAEVQKELKAGWREDRPPWSHPAIGEALAIFGGWVSYYTNARSEDRTADRARFMQAFSAALERDRKGSTKRHIERIGGSGGGPTLIGDEFREALPAPEEG